MHLEMVHKVSADASCRLALTVSIDQTARLWELLSRHLLRVLRIPTGDGSTGYIRGATLSPDGSLAAILFEVGIGREVISLFETGSGRLVRHLPELSQPAYSPVFSRSGRFLAPEGYYDCPPGSEQIFGWQVDCGLDQAVDFFPGAHFRDKYYRPDVISRVLETRDGDKALRLADKQRNKQDAKLLAASERRLRFLPWPSTTAR